MNSRGAPFRVGLANRLTKHTDQTASRKLCAQMFQQPEWVRKVMKCREGDPDIKGAIRENVSFILSAARVLNAMRLRATNGTRASECQGIWTDQPIKMPTWNGGN